MSHPGKVLVFGGYDKRELGVTKVAAAMIIYGLDCINLCGHAFVCLLE